MAHLAFSAHKGVCLNGLPGVWMSLPSFLACSLGNNPVFPCRFAPWLAVPMFLLWASTVPAYSEMQLLQMFWIPLLQMIIQGIALFHALPRNLSTLCLGQSAQTNQFAHHCFSAHSAGLQQAFLLFKPTGCLWTPLLHRLFSHTLSEAKGTCCFTHSAANMDLH